MAHPKRSRRNAAKAAVVAPAAPSPGAPVGRPVMDDAAAATAVPASGVTPTASPAASAPVPGTLHPAAMIHVLRLGPSLSIREVGEYAAEFMTLLNSGPTDIDATALETIDTAGVQLLLAAGAAAQRRGFRLKLTGAMGVKTGAARSLGLSEHLSELAEIVP